MEYVYELRKYGEEEGFEVLGIYTSAEEASAYMKKVAKKLAGKKGTIAITNCVIPKEWKHPICNIVCCASIDSNDFEDMKFSPVINDDCTGYLLKVLEIKLNKGNEDGLDY